jgi:RNA-directed DNA polymerase
MDNLYQSFREFKRGKSRKYDIQLFERNLEDNLFRLHYELKSKLYRHDQYSSFFITDPKVRHIHKATVRDRIVHHAVYRILYPIFDKTFVFDSYSCRVGKGTHRAVNRLNLFIRRMSNNYSEPCFALKCDIRKFFASINHNVLMKLITERVKDIDTLWLAEEIIDSSSEGLPIGNLTSQLFANIYLNELDKFVKHSLKIKYYIRYCDDFIILDNDRGYLSEIESKIQKNLDKNLYLAFHEDKVSIESIYHGIDLLGYIIFPYYRILRTKIKKRMLKRINKTNRVSYSGLLKHCNGYGLKNIIEKELKSNI